MINIDLDNFPAAISQPAFKSDFDECALSKAALKIIPVKKDDAPKQLCIVSQ